MKTYIVGGALRDIILNHKINDIDICLEGEPKKLIHRMKNIKEYIYYDEFHNATIKFENNIEIDLLGVENILLDYSNIYVRILNVLYSIKGEHGQSIFRIYKKT